MATQLKKTVKPAGGDYTTLEACMNANEQNLVTADKYFDVEIDGDWSGTTDTTIVTIHNYTTDATRDIHIYTTATARHQGVWSTSYYKLVCTGTGSYHLIINAVLYVKIEGLQIHYNAAADGKGIIQVTGQATATSGINIGYCILRGYDDAAAWWDYGISAISSPGTLNIYNTVIYGTSQCGIDINSSYAMTIYNCTICACLRSSGGGQGILYTAGTVAVKNCAVFNNTDDFSGAPTIDYCASDDADGTNHVHLNENAGGEWTAAVTAYATRNFHVKDSSSLLYNTGTDLSGSGVTDDIIGTARPQAATYDIGAFELIVGGGGTAYSVACSDGIVFDDTGRKIATLNVAAADGLNLGDGDIGPASFLAAGIDSIALNDLSSMLRFFVKGAADGVAFAEAADRAATFSRIASDAVAFGENAGALASYLAAAADGIALGDESFYAVVGAIEAFAADGIALNDASFASATFQVAAVESILLGDSASRTFTVRLIAEDGIALGDTVSVQVDLDAKAIDGITVHDAAQSLAAYLAAATDGIALQDISINITGNLATGILSVTFTTKKSVITLSGKKSLVAMLGKKSNVSID